MRPVCVVSADFEAEPKERCMLGADYVKAIHRAGGLPLIAPPVLDCADPKEAAMRTCEVAGGLVLTGGADLNPRLFGQSPHPSLGSISPVRDEFEIALASAALSIGLPILAICRGMQVLNVAAGGGLIQDIQSSCQGAHAHAISAPRWHPTHSVSVEPGSALSRILGEGVVWVNSFHHQAVQPVAPGFEVTAWADDGIVEAIEKPGAHFVIGVQWHPESLVERHPEFLKLFSEFVRAAQGMW
ncbi:MAG: gamma-glutamyl-gamma-aminobutyrate hydrolase family protein [Clostridia bacterium]|nr:gamma-glutamyl-gamma-aminobutyrate hydrolase family protein [Clostridia bacterium]